MFRNYMSQDCAMQTMSIVLTCYNCVICFEYLIGLSKNNVSFFASNLARKSVRILYFSGMHLLNNSNFSRFRNGASQKAVNS